MAARAEEVTERADSSKDVDLRDAMNDMYFFAMPLKTFQQLSSAATKRGMTFAAAMKKAFEDFLASGVR